MPEPKGSRDGSEVLELLVRSLHEHEKEMDRLVEKIECKKRLIEKNFSNLNADMGSVLEKLVIIESQLKSIKTNLALS